MYVHPEDLSPILRVQFELRGLARLREAFELRKVVACHALWMGWWGNQRHQWLEERRRPMPIRTLGHGPSMRGECVGHSLLSDSEWGVCIRLTTSHLTSG